MKRRMVKKIVIYILLIAFFAWLIPNIFIASKKNQAAIDEQLPPSYENSADTVLFLPSIRQNISTLVIHNNKYRGEISTLVYDNKYHIVIFKTPLKSGVLLNKIINVNNQLEKTTVGTSYIPIRKGLIYNLLFAAGAIDSITHINLFVDGDIHTLRNDGNILCYSSICKNLSFAYKENVDINISRNNEVLGSVKTFPIEIALIKKGNILYSLFMSPVKINMESTDVHLCDIVSSAGV
jgi:hypothetical protein